MSSVNSTSSVAMYETLSKRGKEELVVQSYMFSFHEKLAGGESRWKCVNRKCRAYLITVSESSRKIEKYVLEHNHEEIEMHILQRQDVSATAKRKAIKNLSERPSQIVCASVSDNHEDFQVEDVKSIKLSAYRARHRLIPSLPTDLKETLRIISDLELRTKFGEDFVTLLIET